MRTQDKPLTKGKRQPPVKTKGTQLNYERSLRQIAREVGRIVNGFKPLDTAQLPKLTETLNRYSALIAPWAAQTGAKMLSDVEKQDAKAWRNDALDLSAGIKAELKTAPIGVTFRQKLAEQVDLITSLPTDAAKRVQKLTLKAQLDSTRASEIAKEIMRSGEVTEARATLIARTEVGRVSTAFTETRATHIGSTGYIWRTAGDSDVRESHREMEGVFVPWNKPPTLDGLTGHAGALPNCRCWPEPVVPDRIK